MPQGVEASFSIDLEMGLRPSVELLGVPLMHGRRSACMGFQ